MLQSPLVKLSTFKLGCLIPSVILYEDEFIKVLFFRDNVGSINSA